MIRYIPCSCKDPLRLGGSSPAFKQCCPRDGIISTMYKVTVGHGRRRNVGQVSSFKQQLSVVHWKQAY